MKKSKRGKIRLNIVLKTTSRQADKVFLKAADKPKKFLKRLNRLLFKALKAGAIIPTYARMWTPNVGYHIDPDTDALREQIRRKTERDVERALPTPEKEVPKKKRRKRR